MLQAKGIKFLLVALACLAVAGQLALAGSNALEWALFKRQHGKSYASAAEEARRFASFLATKALVERHNANASHAYKLGLNHLADWTREERAKLNGLKLEAGSLGRETPIEHRVYLEAILAGFHGKPAPKELDWRQAPGRVSAVKDQGNCGSCWAFATTGLLEGQELGRGRRLAEEMVALSEQELVDCSKSNGACAGGLMDRALEDIHKLGGIMGERDYPYAGTERSCIFNMTKSVLAVAGPVVVRDQDEERLKRLVAKYGPVSAAMYTTDHFMAYQTGVFHDPECPPNAVNHAVLIVGYGTDPAAGDYWLVKNSWRVSWGESGYFRIKRGVNMCSIASMPTIAQFSAVSTGMFA